MINSMTAIAATTTGKIVLGSFAAATALAGASATGIVDFNAADAATDFAADTNAAAATNTNVENGFRVNAGAAGSLGLSVEDGELRLRDIASSAGWSGRLIADADVNLMVSFEHELDFGRTVTAHLALVAPADAAIDVGAFVLATVTGDDGVTSIIRFNTDGSVTADGELELAVATNTTVETATEAVATVDDTIAAAAETVDRTTATATKTADQTVSTATKTADAAVATATETVGQAVATATETVTETTDTAVNTATETVGQATTTVTDTIAETVDQTLATATDTVPVFETSVAVDAGLEVSVDDVVSVDLNLGGGLGLGN